MDEIMERVETVTAEDLTQHAQQYFNTGAVAVTMLGNLNGLKLSKAELAI
jgi:predicted Zn-dependent peptidase